jgi:hypothetical protein
MPSSPLKITFNGFFRFSCWPCNAEICIGGWGWGWGEKGGGGRERESERARKSECERKKVRESARSVKSISVSKEEHPPFFSPLFTNSMSTACLKSIYVCIKRMFALHIRRLFKVMLHCISDVYLRSTACLQVISITRFHSTSRLILPRSPQPTILHQEPSPRLIFFFKKISEKLLLLLIFGAFVFLCAIFFFVRLHFLARVAPAGVCRV